MCNQTNRSLRYKPLTERSETVGVAGSVEASMCARCDSATSAVMHLR